MAGLRTKARELLQEDAAAGRCCGQMGSARCGDSVHSHRDSDVRCLHLRVGLSGHAPAVRGLSRTGDGLRRRHCLVTLVDRCQLCQLRQLHAHGDGVHLRLLVGLRGHAPAVPRLCWAAGAARMSRTDDGKISGQRGRRGGWCGRLGRWRGARGWRHGRGSVPRWRSRVIGGVVRVRGGWARHPGRTPWGGRSGV